MPTALFADGGLDLPEWVKTAGMVVSAILIPIVTVLAALYFRKRDKDTADRKLNHELTAADRKLEHELTDEERQQARRNKSEDEKALDRQRDKLWQRIEAIEASCREENEELRAKLAALYRHIMVERTLVGRWMGKVTGWMDYAVGEAKKAGLELRPFADPPPDLPDPPDMTLRAGEEDV